MLDPLQLKIDIGRGVGGDFIRVTHLPTGISRMRSPPLNDKLLNLRAKFIEEIEKEIIMKGLNEYLLPSKSQT